MFSINEQSEWFKYKKNSMLFCPKSQNSMLFCPKHITACCYVKKKQPVFFFLFDESSVYQLVYVGADQGQCDGVGGRGGVLQGQQRHRERGQRGECAPQYKVHRYWYRRAESSL